MSNETNEVTWTWADMGVFILHKKHTQPQIIKY